MDPSDTQISRMAKVFAERSSPDESQRPIAERAWGSALSYARDAGKLEQMEERMAEAGQDTEIRAAWSRARDPR